MPMTEQERQYMRSLAGMGDAAAWKQERARVAAGEPYIDCNGDPIVVTSTAPAPLTSAERRARIATYRSIVKELRSKGAQERRRLTWLERQTTRDLLADIEALEAEEESHRGYQGAGNPPA